MFGTTTQVGVKVGVDERQIPTVLVGYNRQEAALVPLLTRSDSEQESPPPTLDFIAYLELARDSLAEASTLWAGSDQNARSAELHGEGVNFIKDALNLTKASADQDPAPLPATLVRLGELTNKAQVNAAGTNELLRATRAALHRDNVARDRQLAESKYIASATPTRKEDAYSVIGIFGGNMRGKSKGPTGQETELSGGIAQYFATGIAAQNLSLKPHLSVPVQKRRRPTKLMRMPAPPSPKNKLGSSR